MCSPRASASTQTPLAVAAVGRAIAEFGHEAATNLAAGVGQRKALIRTFDDIDRSEIFLRPGFAVRVGGATGGYLELKAPGKRVPGTRWSPIEHDRKQWQRLALLPEFLYTDGQKWVLCPSCQLADRVTRLPPTLARADHHLAPIDGDFEQAVPGFLTRASELPRTVAQLVRAVAGLRRLLREEIRHSIEREARRVLTGRMTTSFARDLRAPLFPRWDDKNFADAYSRSVTFALLVAQNEGTDESRDRLGHRR